MAAKFPTVKKLLKEYGKSVISEAKTRLRNDGKVASGKLLRSLRYEVQETVDEVTLELSMEEYGEYVDQGREPGKQPPLKKIEKWCKLRGIPKKAAFPIARSIGKYGISPTYFWTISTKRREKQLIRDLEEAYAKDLQNNIKETL